MTYTSAPILGAVKNNLKPNRNGKMKYKRLRINVKNAVIIFFREKSGILPFPSHSELASAGYFRLRKRYSSDKHNELPFLLFPPKVKADTILCLPLPLAERVGFEPTIHCCIPDFESGPL